MYLDFINENSSQYLGAAPLALSSSPAFPELVLDSGCTHSAFRDAGSLTPLSSPLAVFGADSSSTSTCTARTTLPWPAHPSGSVSGLHIPSYRHNLLSVRQLQADGITCVFPGGASHCDLYSRTSRTPFASFRLNRLNLYALTLSSPPVQATSQVPAPIAAEQPVTLASLPACTCRSLAHPTMLHHLRLGHPGFGVVRKVASARLLADLPAALPAPPVGPGPPCPACVEGKMRESPHPSAPSMADAPLLLVHLDVWGPHATASREGHRYALLLVDDHSRYASTYLLRSKAEAPSLIDAWIRQARVKHGRPLHVLHSDGGGEFVNARVKATCAELGIQHELTLPDSPELNGVAERRLGLITTTTRCLLAHSRAPLSLWGYAMLHATRLTNMLPHPLRPDTTPYALWHGSRPSAKRLRVWGSLAYVLDPACRTPARGGKLAPRPLLCVFLGLNPDAPGWLFLHPSSGKLLRSQDVVFDESTPFYARNPLTPPPQLTWAQFPVLAPPPGPPLVASPPAVLPPPVVLPLTPPAPAAPRPGPDTQAVPPAPPRAHRPVLAAVPEEAPADATASVPVPPPSPPLRPASALPQPVSPRVLRPRVPAPVSPTPHTSPRRTRSQGPATPRALSVRLAAHTPHPAVAVPPAPTASLTLVEDVFDDLLQVRSFVPLALSSENAAIPTPASYTEAVSGPHSEEWLQAITTELEAFARNGSYVDVPRPPHTNVVKGKWVFRVKNLPNEPPVFKARYCAKGFTQKHGVDFFDTFSPTAKLPTVRALLDLAARSDFEVHSMDVSNAFLQGHLREQIFMERPQGFTAPFPSGSVWQLRRPVYGLKQAPLEWNRKLTATLTELGFGPSSADPCLFVRAQPSRMFIIVYVDDMIIVAEDPAALVTVKQNLSSRLLCKDLGELKHYLGMEMTRDRAARTISLSQSFYVNSVLQRFGMVAATPVSTPIELDH